MWLKKIEPCKKRPVSVLVGRQETHEHRCSSVPPRSGEFSWKVKDYKFSWEIPDIFSFWMGQKDIVRAIFPLVFWYFFFGNLLSAGRLSPVSRAALPTARPATRDGTNPPAIPGFAIQPITSLAKQQGTKGFCQILQCLTY